MDHQTDLWTDGSVKGQIDEREGGRTKTDTLSIFFVAPENRDVTLAVNENGSEEAKLTSGETPIGMRRKSTQFKPPKLGP